jgi:hypothetical protein
VFTARSLLRPVRFNPRQRPPCIHCIGGCVGPRFRLSVLQKRKMFFPYRDPVQPCPQFGTMALANSTHSAHLPVSGTVAVAAKTLCDVVVEFVDGIRTVWFNI